MGTTEQQMLQVRLLKTLSDLISYQSINPPGTESELAEYVGNLTRVLGATVDFEEVCPGRKNVIAQWDFGSGNSHLILNAHLDVVPPTPGQWICDPFQMTVIDEKAYGRGACDTKGSLASMLLAIENVLKDTQKLKGKLILTGVIGEETGGIGTQHYVRNLNLSRKYSDEYMAIIGEPTGLEVVVAHKGITRRKVTFNGKAAHASDPALGDNALYKASKLILGIEKLNNLLSKKAHELLGSPCISATVIHGGVKDNVIPDYCEVSIDRRRIPGEEPNILNREIQEIMQEYGVNSSEYQIEDLGSDKEPVDIPVGETIVQIALEALSNVKDTKGEPKVFVGGTDMPFLVNNGKIPTVVFGPGYLAQAHTVNEFVPVQHLLEATKVYEKIIQTVLSR